jgi:hypothetical protein
MTPELQSEMVAIGGFLYIVAIIVGIIYGLIWSFGLLDLLLNTARLAKAAARWLETHAPTAPTLPPTQTPPNIGGD